MANVLIEQDTMADIADAIRGKNGSVSTYTPAQMITAIANIPTGGGSANLSDPVRFFDYDGTLVYSYSAADFTNLNALPDNPSHSGLTAQGWNWALADAKTYVATYGKLDIGQMYITDDDKTRIYIRLADSAGLSPYFGICPNGEVRVDWGDGSNMTTFSGSSFTTVIRGQHTYASTGDYVITLEVINGSFAIYGDASYGTCLLTRTDTRNNTQRYYQNAIQKVELGANVSATDYAFFDCRSLASITIPSSATAIGTYAFHKCYSLKSITIPSSVTSIGAYAFQYCYSLASIMIPNSVTSVGAYVFSYCWSLARITIPSNMTSTGDHLVYDCRTLESIIIPNSVTSVDTSTLANCYSLAGVTIPSSVTSIGDHGISACYSLASITIPNSVTVLNTSAFSNCESFASVTIPSSVTSIGANAFYGCHGITEIHLLRISPPTLENKSAFSDIPSDCIFYVPSASIGNYKRATNWSTYASKMVGE